MKHDKQLFDSLFDITGERDTRSLEASLIRTVADYIEFDGLMILRRFEHNDHLQISTCIPANSLDDLGELNIEPDKDMRRCMEQAEIVVTADANAARTLFPISIHDTVVNILAVHSPEPMTDAQAIIHGFTRIYSNFLTILHDNEHDSMTGLLNREPFDQRLSELVRANPARGKKTDEYEGECRRGDVDSTHNWVGVLDIDHFKSINDNYGHLFGDEVLLLFSDQMKKAFRSNDLLFRYGGEEFVVVLSPVSEQDAVNTFERFRRTIEEFEFPQIGRVTVSIGVVMMEEYDCHTTILEAADQALYYAKEHGRNQVCNYHQLTRDGAIKRIEIVDDFEMF